MPDTPPTRVYALGDLTVEWRQPLCTQCKNCKTGLPNVFDPSRRPWIDLTQAPADEIREQVAACPSGALKIGEPREK